MVLEAYYTRIMFDWSGETGLATLFAAAFVSATVLPANSEIVLFAVLRSFPERALEAIVVATLGNTLGGATTYGIGWVLPNLAAPARMRLKLSERALAWVRRYGALALLLAWMPVVGDALCLAAGWLRVPLRTALLAMAAGKLARYLAVAQAAALF
jgi:membrane protein YqaA with SNARE-associated domain